LVGFSTSDLPSLLLAISAGGKRGDHLSGETSMSYGAKKKGVVPNARTLSLKNFILDLSGDIAIKSTQQI
jgi:hypothetical protein